MRLDSSLPQVLLKAGRPGDRGLADSRVTREDREARERLAVVSGCLPQGVARNGTGPVNTSINELCPAFLRLGHSPF